MGKLNYASTFIPDYKRRVVPLKSLLSKKSTGKWEPRHTDCLNQLAELVHQRVELGLCDMSLAAKLYVDVDEEHIGAVLVQGEKRE